ncbi:histone acetylation protein-domain-containing protein [Massariosphaeria phaeospora]|uniref:histone acetyltransferase n=1 Tax=Massariosphaeria phaeospora TaxID=100035 RepID=A0A7C8I5H9_9PLEO|nr:histone acetylation protein-domain-containing protein [Massariosphaeria phaeospora]
MASIATSESLHNLLAHVLPKQVPFTFYHCSTPPTRSPALFSAPPHSKPERTYCESHSLAVSIVPKDSIASGTPDELLILAIEVLVYTTKNLTTIFVSKADSTGYIATLNLPRSQAGSPLKAICGTFVSWLARERRREGTKLVVSLFARAQDQYLFPASIENPDKHVLDDRGLVKWWCRVLDPILREYAAEVENMSLTERLANGAQRGVTSSSSETTAKGYLVIPGFEQNDTLRYIPSSPSTTSPRRWVSTHPLLQIAPQPGAPPRCLVPHFPDDPKSRFLDELDEELPNQGTDTMSQQGGTPSRGNGQWKSVRTLDQFWDMMAYRQECSSGRIVGFIWVVITPPDLSVPDVDDNDASQHMSQSFSQESMTRSQSPLKKPPKPKKTRRRKVNTKFGPIPLILPRIQTSTSNLSTASSTSNGVSKLPPETTAYFKWPTASRGTILLSTRDYHRAHEVLLQQNFSKQGAAARSTKRWKDEVAILAGVEAWSWTIVGQKECSQLAGTVPNENTPVTLVSVRRKRKPEEGVDAEAPGHGVKTLGVGLVRKKPKA